jgi:hypothetical protein
MEKEIVCVIVAFIICFFASLKIDCHFGTLDKLFRCMARFFIAFDTVHLLNSNPDKLWFSKKYFKI